MAKTKQIERLKQGVERWNKWRTEHPGEHIDHSGANLSWADLTGAVLSKADLTKADLRRAVFFRVRFPHTS